MKRYNPKRAIPKSYAELLAWIMVRLPRDVESVGRRFAVRWTFDERREPAWTLRGACGDAVHLPQIADEFAKHSFRIEDAEIKAGVR